MINDRRALMMLSFSASIIWLLVTITKRIESPENNICYYMMYNNKYKMNAITAHQALSKFVGSRIYHIGSCHHYHNCIPCDALYGRTIHFCKMLLFYQDNQCDTEVYLDTDIIIRQNPTQLINSIKGKIIMPEDPPFLLIMNHTIRKDNYDQMPMDKLRKRAGRSNIIIMRLTNKDKELIRVRISDYLQFIDNSGFWEQGFLNLILSDFDLTLVDNHYFDKTFRHCSNVDYDCSRTRDVEG